MDFTYGEKEIEYLKAKDKRLGEAIDQIGYIHRSVMPDCFVALVYNIIGQQISTAALNTIWNRLSQLAQEVNPETIDALSEEQLQTLGMSYRKAKYIKEFAAKVRNGELDLDELQKKNNEEVIKELCKLRGVGKWTAEMILIFSMQRMDVVSYGDFGILRGMRMLYHHRKIDKKLFDKYARRYSPYGTVASFYLWAIAGGAIPGLKDYQEKS